MKRIVRNAVVLGAVTLASVATLHAQEEGGRASFHVAGGITLPTGDFGDAFGTGWQGLAGVNFSLGSLPFGVRVDGFYGQNNGDEDVTGPDVKVKMFGGLVGAQWGFGGADSPVSPYLLGQVGMTNSKVDVPTVDLESETDITVALGGGIGFGLGSLAAFTEGQYVIVMTEDESSKFIVVRLGLRFGGGM
jgi:hypothetical protein